ncbi:MAG: heme ABC transporter ATP-binding protein [Ilumatobacter coccineus]|uniref:Heme ABC transporter ATP-binding protein n=1 Tax=Ilumatobacter coccineus TaxID=467094 RepID=A0A2G6KAH9_9ACTN|nr:MAG: heme ABC transporter ATP-binding protein [Ilumatobacter coccineus]
MELVGITKRFPGVIANDNVNLKVEPGEIHAICGENGAGKSTLMKILYGMQPADEGQMFINGEEVHFSSPTDAIEAGIGMVHQHFMLADQMTVLDNVILGSEPANALGVIDYKKATDHLKAVGDAYGLTIDPHDLIEELEVGEQQRVEIIKVLYRGARILILDEPTAVLVPQEVEELFRNLRELQAGGATIIFIDHKLQEVLDISDRITIIRRGKTITTVDADSVTAADLAELMVGSELPTPSLSESTVTDEPALVVDNVTVLDEDKRPSLDGVSLTVHKGEVLGIAGIEGNGQSELIGAIIGTEDIASGKISLMSEDISRASVRKRREAGIAFVPQDRHHEGLLLDASLWENAALGHQTKTPFSKGFWIDRPGSRERTQSIRSDFDVRSPGVDVIARALSGGNQQKLIIGREMTDDPTVLIAAHPTRGIDVGAQADVWNDIRAARRLGLATLLISADLDELIGLSDRLVVMFHGHLVAELDPAEVTPRLLGSYMTGAALAETGDQS